MGSLSLICLVLIIGIFGNVEHGGSLWNLLWCIPLLAVMGVCAFVGEVENQRELRRYERWRRKGVRKVGFRTNGDR